MAWRGYFQWAFPFKRVSTWDIDNNSCQTNDLWWICAGHINIYHIDGQLGQKKKKQTILKFRKENTAHLKKRWVKMTWHHFFRQRFCLATFFLCLVPSHIDHSMVFYVNFYVCQRDQFDGFDDFNSQNTFDAHFCIYFSNDRKKTKLSEFILQIKLTNSCQPHFNMKYIEFHLTAKWMDLVSYVCLYSIEYVIFSRHRTSNMREWLPNEAHYWFIGKYRYTRTSPTQTHI